MKYADKSGHDGEMLVDVDALYGRVKRSVQPEARARKEQTGLELHAERVEKELADHPYGTHPYGSFPAKEALSLQRAAKHKQ